MLTQHRATLLPVRFSPFVSSTFLRSLCPSSLLSLSLSRASGRGSHLHSFHCCTSSLVLDGQRALVGLFRRTESIDRSVKMATDEAIIAKQRYFQSVHKLTHLKSPSDKFTSVAIPFALVGLGALLMGRGLGHLYTGTGKKEGH